MSSAQTLNAFLKRYLDDQWSGNRRTLDEYVQSFPGHDAAIAEMYTRLESDGAAASDAGQPIERIGPYRIVREVGRGGQGVVYAAVDERLGRRVALKVLTGLGSLASNRVARFLREAEVASKLDHPGIATVYEIGTDGGVPFIAMRFVDGETLAARIGHMTADEAQSAESVRTAAAIAEKAARALHAAHEAGIIHRDVKPGNILIQSDGDPVLVDFGLAHDTDSELLSLTRTGEFFGTPAYMSPEQIASHAARPDRRTDVWSLGATLYECLTLKRPFDAPTREQLYRAVLAREPRDPGRINEAIPEDLAAIVEMALQKEVDRRYETAAAMADDLAAFAAGRPVAARRIGPAGRVVRWARREPAKAGLLVLALVALPTIAVLLTSYLSNRGKVEAARLTRREEQKDELLAQAAYEFGEGAPGRALPLLERAAAIEGGSPEAVFGIVAVLLDRDDYGEALATLDRNDALVHGLRVGVMLRSQALVGLGRKAEAIALEQSAPKAMSAADFYLEGLRLIDEGHAGREAAFREAVSIFRSAICNAASPRALYFEGLAHAAWHADDVAAAREVGRSLRLHWPRSSHALYWAGTALSLVSTAEAITTLREALAIDPGHAPSWCNLGSSQEHAGLLDEALASAREAIRLDPELAEARVTLGRALLRKGRADEAIATDREAIRLRPKFAGAHAELGAGLTAKRSFDEAIASCQEAIRLEPRSVKAHVALGNAQSEKGLLDEAIGTYWKAIIINCFDPTVHFNLGIALRAKGLVTESIASYREAIRLRPAYAEARCNLGRTLARDGQFAAALVELRKGHELGAKDPSWSYPSAKWIAEVEDQIRQERRLLAIEEGQRPPDDAKELVGLGNVAALTKRWRTAVDWFQAAFDADPGLKETDRWPFKAARAAVQAATAPDAESRPGDSARLRALAFEWLETELRYERDLVDEEIWDDARFRQSRAEWMSDPALAPVRDAPRVATFPPEEARAWTALWAEVR